MTSADAPALDEVRAVPLLVAARARRWPQRTAVTGVARDGSVQHLAWGELDRRANQLARLYGELGVGVGGTVVVGLPNGIEHVVACLAAWKLGAYALPLNPAAPRGERDAHLALASPAVVVADWPDLAGLVDRDARSTAAELPDDPLPELPPLPGKIVGTGGSTGRPKLIVTETPWGMSPGLEGLLAACGLRRELVHLVPGPLHHNLGYDWCFYGLMLGNTVVLLERFAAELAVQVIEQQGVQYTAMVPTMLKRIAALGPAVRSRLTNLESVLHTAAPCPPAVKRAWIELIGAERVLEAYGASDGQGVCLIRGDEWLEHPGSCGRPYECEVQILDESGTPVPVGDVGEVFMRGRVDTGHHYLGADLPPGTADGFHSVGDLGRLDADGYLYIADRRTDLVISGGANIYPAEVEAVLNDHPAVADVAVVGLPDDDLGQRVHAVIQLDELAEAPGLAQLQAHCRAQLAAYKVPRSVAFVPRLPRDDGGKLRRSAVRDAAVADAAGGPE